MPNQFLKLPNHNCFYWLLNWLIIWYCSVLNYIDDIKNAWINFRYPYVVRYATNNPDEYAEMLDWVRNNLSSYQKRLWFRCSKITTHLSTTKTNVRFECEVRFKNKNQQLLFKLRYGN